MDIRSALFASRCRLLLLFVGFALAGLCRAEETESKDPKFEQRLLIFEIRDGVLRGAQPEAGDYAKLAELKGVKQAIFLGKEGAVPAACVQAAQQAGITYRYETLTLPTADGEPARFDRDAVKRFATALKDAEAGVYIHDDTGRNLTGVVNFAYRVKVDGWEFADALTEVLKRGFQAADQTGFYVDMKLLATGLSELPNVTLPPISDVALYKRGDQLRGVGVRLNVKQLGEGSPLYTVHGGPGESHLVFRPFLDPFGKNHTLVYYDQRGCGSSTRPQFAEAYSIDRSVADLESLRNELGHDKIALLAQSSGGAIAVRYALKYPEHVSKLVIVSSWASAEEMIEAAPLAMFVMPRADQEAVAEVFGKLREQRRGFNDAELSELQAYFYPAQFFGSMSNEVREDWTRRSKLSAMVYDAMGREYFGNEQVPERLDLRPQLKDVKDIPTLVIGGKMDIVTPPNVVRTFAEGIPGANFELIENCGHYPFVEKQDEFIKLVEDFLESE